MLATGSTASPARQQVRAVRTVKPTPADLAVGALAGLIFAVPAAVLIFGDSPGRFGAQVYSGYGIAEASWTDPDDIHHRIDLTDYLASPRREIDWTSDLPQRLCARIPQAVTVQVRQSAPDAARSRTARC